MMSGPSVMSLNADCTSGLSVLPLRVVRTPIFHQTSALVGLHRHKNLRGQLNVRNAASIVGQISNSSDMPTVVRTRRTALSGITRHNPMLASPARLAMWTSVGVALEAYS